MNTHQVEHLYMCSDCGFRKRTAWPRSFCDECDEGVLIPIPESEPTMTNKTELETPKQTKDTDDALTFNWNTTCKGSCTPKTPFQPAIIAETIIAVAFGIGISFIFLAAIFRVALWILGTNA